MGVYIKREVWIQWYDKDHEVSAQDACEVLW